MASAFIDFIHLDYYLINRGDGRTPGEDSEQFVTRVRKETNKTIADETPNRALKVKITFDYDEDGGIYSAVVAITFVCV